MTQSNDNILVLTNDENKVCGRCKKTLPILRFYRKRKAVDIYQDWCIDCLRQYKAENRARKEVVKARIGHFTIDEVMASYQSLDRSSLIVLRNVLASILKVIDKKLK